MGMDAVNGATPNNTGVGQYADLLKKINAQGTAQATGTEESKDAVQGLGLNGPSVVVTDAPQDPTAPTATEQRQTTASPEVEKAVHSFQEATIELGTAIQKFMATYNLTENDCITFLEESVAQSNGTAQDKPRTQAAVGKLIKGSDSSAYGKIMFDLYALLALMQETAQKERNAASLIRTQESLQVQQAITEQADMQRYAATLGLVFGLISAGISIVQVIHSGIQTGRGMQQESQLRAEYGVNQASQNFASASSAAKPAMEAKNALGTAQVKMENELPAGQSDAVKADCAGGVKTKETILSEIDQNQALTPDQKTTAKAYTEAFFTNKDVLANGGATALENYTAAKSELNAKSELMKQDARLVEANHLQDLQGIRAMRYGVFTKLFDSVGNTWAGLKNAEATEKGAEVKRAEEELEQIKDIYKQHADVIQTVLSTLKAIQQAESQTIQGMFRA